MVRHVVDVLIEGKRRQAHGTEVNIQLCIVSALSFCQVYLMYY